jgi:ABC-type sugar transport system ATPase subunit
MNMIPFEGRTLGVRPERFELTPSEGAIPLQVTITAIEFIGHEWLVHAKVNDTFVIMRRTEPLPASIGAIMTWHAPAQAIRWFA